MQKIFKKNMIKLAIKTQTVNSHKIIKLLKTNSQKHLEITYLLV